MIAELHEVTKRFGPVTALDHVDLAVAPGEVIALLGPNGAGKSTAIDVLLGLRVPDQGVARLNGLDPRCAAARRRIGVTPQDAVFPPTLRVDELIALVRCHFRHAPAIDEICARFRLEPLRRRQLGGLSGGERRLVAVALAFAGGPELVVLDEPTTGLDSDARRSTWAVIRSHAACGGTALLTTHHLDEAEALATRIVLIDAGRVVKSGTVSEIKAAAGLTRVAFRAPASLELEGGVRDGERLCFAVADAGALVESLIHDGVKVPALEVRPLSLEEALAYHRATA